MIRLTSPRTTPSHWTSPKPTPNQWASPKTSLNRFSFLRKMSMSRPVAEPEYTPVPISPTTRPMPVVRQPKWNLNIMIPIWIFQFGVGSYLELACTFVFQGLMHDGSHMGWEVLMVVIFALNLIFLLAPLPYEVYHFRAGSLTARGYMRLQISKCIYLGLLMFWPLLILGVLTPMMLLELLSPSGSGIFAVLYIVAMFLMLFCGPFVGGWFYARKVNNMFKKEGELDAERGDIEFRGL